MTSVWAGSLNEMENLPMNRRLKASSREDLLLAALYASPHKTLSPVQVQKAMFLLSQEAKDEVPPKFYKFEKYNYGPFCQQLYQDLLVFAGQHLLVIDQQPSSRVRLYRLTDAGTAKGKHLSAQLSAPFWEYIQRVAQWVTSLPFQDLVRAIYQRYPEYKENSIFSG